jgi:hypothetical protein
MEKWKDIANCKNSYLISNKGNVKSLIARANKKEFIMAINLDKDGYEVVGLFINKKKILKKVHRLVALAYIENPLNKPQVNHINGVKTDNDVNNLEWCTAKENIRHSFKTGLSKNHPGTDRYNSKLLDKDIVAIRRLGRVRTGVELAKAFNVSKQLINNILLRKTWKHIKEEV